MITPIIMESEIEEVRKKLARLKISKINRVHIDIGDGLFCELLNILPADLRQVDLKKMKVDIHLLVDEPSAWIEKCVELKPRRLIAQIERMGSQEGFLKRVESYGVEAGMALQIETPIEEIEDVVLKRCKTILLLAIPAGTSGCVFDKRILGKIEELRKKYQGKILIDGGITPKVYERVLLAGATEVGSNSWFWRYLRQGFDKEREDYDN